MHHSLRIHEMVIASHPHPPTQARSHLCFHSLQSNASLTACHLLWQLGCTLVSYLTQIGNLSRGTHHHLPKVCRCSVSTPEHRLCPAFVMMFHNMLSSPRVCGTSPSTTQWAQRLASVAQTSTWTDPASHEPVSCRPPPSEAPQPRCSAGRRHACGPGVWVPSLLLLWGTCCC